MSTLAQIPAEGLCEVDRGTRGGEAQRVSTQLVHQVGGGEGEAGVDQPEAALLAKPLDLVRQLVAQFLVRLAGAERGLETMQALGATAEQFGRFALDSPAPVQAGQGPRVGRVAQPSGSRLELEQGPQDEGRVVVVHAALVAFVVALCGPVSHALAQGTVSGGRFPVQGRQAQSAPLLLRVEEQRGGQVLCAVDLGGLGDEQLLPVRRGSPRTRDRRSSRRSRCR